MINIFKIIRSFWQIGFVAVLALIMLEMAKPGFVISQINLQVILISVIIIWLVDNLRTVEKFKE